MKVDIYDSYKPIRNYIRNFDPNNVINFCIKIFREEIDDTHPTKWRYLPNTVMLIIRWTLLEWEPKPEYKTLTTDEFNKIYSKVANLIDQKDSNLEDIGLHNFFSKLLQSQKLFQIHKMQVEAGIGRQRIIFKKIDGVKIEQIYNQYSDITLDEYFKIITTLWAMHFTNQNFEFQKTYFNSLSKNENIFEILSCDLTEAKRFLKQNSKIEKNISFQIDEITPLIKKPLYKNKNTYKPYSKHLLSYYIIYGLYEYFKIKNPNFSSHIFGSVFEQYIKMCLNYCKSNFKNNSQFPKELKKQYNCDFIIHEEENTILIEAKSAELNNIASVIRDEETIIRNIESTIIKAFIQIQNTAKYIKNDSNQNIYGLVVTYKDYLIGNNKEFWNSRIGKYIKNHLEEKGVEIIFPLEKTLIISIEDFEYIVSGSLEKNISINKTIDFIISNNNDSKKSKFFIRDHLRELYGELTTPSFLIEEHKQQFKEIEEALKNPPE